MPLKRFTCSDGQEIAVEECLKKCRLSDRCCHISFLKKAAEQRKWTGTPSVTQLQNGTCQSYLEVVKDYAIVPGDRAFAIFGTAVHSILEQDLERMKSKHGFTGLPDVFENGELIDFKVSSVYTRQDTIDKWAQQINAYRLLLEEAGHKVNRMRVQLICRDAKRTRGHPYLKWIDIPHIEDDIIIKYFVLKREVLLNALESKKIPPQCTSEENWGGTKCKYFCSTAKECPYYEISI